MTDDMIERVATAIHRAMPGRENSRLHLTPVTILLARAAIEAMREPTGAMITDGGNAKVRNWDTAKETFLDDPCPVWKAMIDAALKVPDESNPSPLPGSEPASSPE